MWVRMLYPMTMERGAVLHWEDFFAGREFELGLVTLERDEILAFAHRWDPQAFHVASAAAEDLGLTDVIASGWHTVCACCHLLVTSLMALSANRPGPAVDEVRWPHPVLPGDSLEVAFQVLNRRRSASRPDRGIVVGRLRAVNQRGEEVLTLQLTSIIALRPTATDVG